MRDANDLLEAGMIMRWSAVIVAGMIASAGVWAQDKKVQDPAQSKELNTEAYVELLREDVQAKRLDVIKEGMQLDEKQAAAFWPVYDEYAGEQKKLGDQKLADHSGLCEGLHDHGRCQGRRTGAKSDGVGGAADRVAQEILRADEKGSTDGAGGAILAARQSGSDAN